MGLPAPLPDIIDPPDPILTVGRGPRCDVRLALPGVADLHAELWLHDGKLQVHAHDHRTPVRVNGKPVKLADLQDRDEVEFGPVRYHVVGQHLELHVPAGMAIDVEHLTVDRNGRRLFDRLNFHAKSNEFVGVLAPSGAGKTTLLKCLAGFFTPDGRITFDCRELGPDTLTEFRAAVGYVAQGDMLLPTLTGRENLYYAARLRMAGRLRSAEIRSRVDHLLERLGLHADADRPVRFLSGGQRRRLNVGVELVGRPQLLLLDEPTAGLDPATETRLMRLLREVTGDGTTVVCTTHVLDNLAMFDRVMVLADRRIDYAGPPAGLLPKYGARSYPELYEKIDRRPQLGVVPAGLVLMNPDATKSSEKPGPTPRSLPDQCPVRACVAKKLRLRDQVRVLTGRALAALWRDRGWLALTVIQPLAIGMLINVSQLVPSSATVGITFAVVAAVWLGLNNTAREVVRERALYTRERLLGVTPCGYLCAKVAAFGAVGLLQVAALWWVVTSLSLIPADDTAGMQIDGWSWGYGVAVLWGAYLGALALGLLVSSIARSEESAVAALPLIILPQLLLTGVATGLGTVEDHGWFQPVALKWRSVGAPPPPAVRFDELPELGENGEISHSVSADAPAAHGMPSYRKWALEGLSAVTFTRPAVDLLHPRWYYEKPGDFRLARASAAHLAGVVGLTAVLLTVGFVLMDRKRLRDV
ncbi:MAG: ATP-binding cassette domain-containing protein [Fimbriiglobus sp.]